MLEQTVVYLFVALVLIGGGMAAFSRQVLYAIIGLGISLLGLAGLFLTNFHSRKSYPHVLE